MRSSRILYLLVGISMLMLNAYVIITFKRPYDEKVEVDLESKSLKFSNENFNSTNQAFEVDKVINKVINPHNFQYLINAGSSICKTELNDNNTILLLAMIPVSATSFERRLIIRTTWANRSMFPKLRYVFMLGKSQNEVVNKKIQKENDIYGDIVQEVF
jgi:hypothetical protein